MADQPISKDNLSIYVFSFNRGQFLNNCLHSVACCAREFDATVIDDQSDDPTTLEALGQHASRMRIITAGTDDNPEHKTGGLYNNMTFAFEDAKARGFSHLLFLQDDMQLVRPILVSDLEAASRFFEANPASAELHTCFMKRFYKERDEALMTLDASGEAYLRPSDYQGFSGFSAVGLFDIERFERLFGSLRRGEYANNEFAQRNAIQMGVSARPFMMWLPYPVSYRGKQRDIPLQLVEGLSGCGFYPYEIMAEPKVEKFLNRHRSKAFPYAEDWLNCSGVASIPVWSFAGGLSNLKARGGARALLGRFLDSVKRTFS